MEPGQSRPIITITLNPALDVSTAVDVVTPEHKLRCDAAVREPGGGGINVARVCDRLGAEVTALTVVGGAVGRQLVSLLEEEGITTVPVASDDETRQCFAVQERSTDRQYRFVLPGRPLDLALIDAVGEAVCRLVALLRDRSAEPLVVMSGSVPPETEAGAVERLISAFQPADVIVDTSGPALVEALRCPVLLVKPSARELQSVVGRRLDDESQILAGAKEVLAGSAARALLVSVGAGGAMLVRHGGDPVRLRAPAVRVRSAVGAGDSLVGGLTVGLSRSYDLQRAAALGIAAGTATVISAGSGLCAAADVDDLLPLVTAAPA
ncbi:MAG: 1-phosphofructokinase family hexose kinase [Acidimicrobiales bacterium]